MATSEVHPGLALGDGKACSHGDPGTAAVHACKRPCHQRAVGYSGTLPQSHDEYLVARRDTDLYLNFVDMDRAQEHRFMKKILSSALDFIEEQITEREVVVHCSQGRSRAPTIGMLYLAKRAGEIPDGSFAETAEAFVDLYPGYAPARGIRVYLGRRWGDLA